MVIINYGLFWLNICFQRHALALVTLQHSRLIFTGTDTTFFKIFAPA